MWYRIRYAYNLLLTAFQIIGLVLCGLGGAAIVLLAIGAVFSALQRLLGYDLLLTQDIASWVVGFGIWSSILGGILFFLGLGATDPKFLEQLEKEKGGS